MVGSRQHQEGLKLQHNLTTRKQRHINLKEECAADIGERKGFDESSRIRILYAERGVRKRPSHFKQYVKALILNNRTFFETTRLFLPK